MAGQDLSTPGVSSRRSACDRCRGQKLRCLREDSESDVDGGGRCDRCAKADAQCITSPIYHIRNVSFPIQKETIYSTSRKRRRPENINRLPVAQVPPSSTHDSEDTPCTAPPHIIATNTFDWVSTNCAISNSSLNLTPTPSNWNSSTGVVATPASMSDPISTSVPANANNRWDADITFSPDGIDQPFNTYPQTTVNDNTQTFAGSQSPLDTQSHGGFWLPHKPNFISNSDSDNNVGAFASGYQSHDTMNHMPSQLVELSRVNLELATQLGRMTKGPPYVNLKTLIDPACGNPSGPPMTTQLEDILNSTRQFIDILGLITDSLPPLAPDAAKLPATHNNHPSTSSTTSSYQIDSCESSDSSSVQPDYSTSEPPLDFSLLTLVLVCYVHILKLHVALFEHIQQYLQTVAESDDPKLIPLPGLCGLDNLPLRRYQMLIFFCTVNMLLY